MSKYQTFIFKRYIFEADKKTLQLYYGYDNALEFCETYTFDFDFVDYDLVALDRALQLLFFMAGVSYYKMYLAPETIVESGEIDGELAAFLSKTYQRGLGEFFYLNQLDPLTPIQFPMTSAGLEKVHVASEPGQLIGLGGGKDSLLTTEFLRDQPRVATWSLNHQSQLQPLVERIGLPHFSVERAWDQQIKALNQQDALNGHVPISAIFSCVGLVVSILTGYHDSVVSNESTASEPTLHAGSTPINHQYSKSLEYEQDFQSLLRYCFGDSLAYYSFLRPITELRIGELFATYSFQTYRDVFSSCNRAYTHDQDEMFWCGECSKCAFVFLVLAPFLSKAEVEGLWGGKNLLLEPSLEPTYRQLLGIEGDKPFDCVGDIKEARAGMNLCQELYPELQEKYQFELPANYDFRALSEHSMPAEMFTILESKLSS